MNFITRNQQIEEELPGWKVHVAPLEAVEIPEYLKRYNLVINTN